MENQGCKANGIWCGGLYQNKQTFNNARYTVPFWDYVAGWKVEKGNADIEGINAFWGGACLSIIDRIA